jgi:hypothetical protein
VLIITVGGRDGFIGSYEVMKSRPVYPPTGLQLYLNEAVLVFEFLKVQSSSEVYISRALLHIMFYFLLGCAA